MEQAYSTVSLPVGYELRVESVNVIHEENKTTKTKEKKNEMREIGDTLGDTS